MTRLFRERAKPGTTERTIAALISRATTRVNIELNPAAKTMGIAGMYVPKTDAILLFDTGGRVSATSVALEEAGHSRQRHDYLKYEKRAEGLREKLAQWHPRANIVLDWSEDHRVYHLLKDDYPGAHADLDHTWKGRQKDTGELGFDLRDTAGGARCSPAQQAWLAGMHEITNKLIEVAGRYFSDFRFPDFPAVLKDVEDWLKKQPPTKKQARDKGSASLLLAGKDGDQRGTPEAGKAQMVQPGDTAVLEILVTVAGSAEEADMLIGGLGISQVDYPWRVISNDVMQLEGNEDADW